MPGIDAMSSTAVRKGPTFASTCVSSVAMAASLSRVSALAHAIGSTLAGTLVVAWTYAGPRDEMCGRREPAHVDSDLGDDDVSAEVLDAWNRPYEFDCGAKGPKPRSGRCRAPKFTRLACDPRCY